MNKKLLDIDKVRINSILLFFIGIICYIVPLALRYHWYDVMSAFEFFKHNGVLNINNSDGYYYAEGAKEILSGKKLWIDYGSSSHLISYLTAFSAYVTKLKLEWIILLSPAILSSLIVFPALYLGRLLKNDYLGIFCALTVGLVKAYYDRTLIGYYDTDMLNVVFPLILVVLLYNYFSNINRYVGKKRNITYLILIAVVALLYNYWYPQSKMIVIAYALFSTFLILIFSKEKHEIKGLFYRANLMLVIAYLPVPIYVDVPLIIVYLFILARTAEIGLDANGEVKTNPILKVGKRSFSSTFVIFIISIIVFALYVILDFHFIKYNFDLYLLRGATGSKLHYLNVTKTIQEARLVPLSFYASKLIGHPILLIISVLGTIILFIKRPLIILFIPFFALGYLSMKLGLRFTFYGVPLAVLGYFYFAFAIINLVKNSIKFKKILKTLIIFCFAVPIWALNIQNMYYYVPKPLPMASEIKALEAIKADSTSDNDLVLSWWDYGYAIRYYSGLNTLVDGEIHSGSLNFPIAYMFTKEQYKSRNMVKYIYNKLISDGTIKNNSDYIYQISDDQGLTPNQFLMSLEDPNLNVKTDGNIYIYIPYKMLRIFPVIELFQSRNIETGVTRRRKLFMSTGNIVATAKHSFKATLNAKTILAYNGNTDTFSLNKRVIAVSYFIETRLVNGKTKLIQKTYNPRAGLAVLYLKDAHKIVLLNTSLLNSTYVRLSLLGLYNKNIFKLVYANKYAVVYKLRR